MMQIRYRRIEDADAVPFNRLLAGVIAEQVYLDALEPFDLDETRAFIRSVNDGDWPQQLAIARGDIVGWCDILPRSAAEPPYVGMGVSRPWRRQGIGRMLLASCIGQASERGIGVVRLQVFTDNCDAIALYESLGFRRCGVREEYRRVRGTVQGLLSMELQIPANGR